MIRLWGKLFCECRGATAVEYGLILSLVVLAMMGALITFADTSIEMWNNVSASVREASS